MSTQRSRVSRHPPRNVARAAACFACTGLLLTLISASSAAAKEHVTIKFDSLLCVEESDTWGEDDAYVVTVGVNLRTGRTRAQSYGFPSIGNGDHHVIPSDKGVVFADWVEDPKDVLVLVALMECEGCNVLLGGEGGMGKSMANRAQQDIDRLAKQFSPSIQSGSPPQAVAQALQDRMRNVVDQIRGGDQVLGLYSFGMDGQGYWQRWLTGDSWKYQVAFQRVAGNPSASITFKEKLRIHVRDSILKKSLPARVQVISDGGILADRQADTNGLFEEALLPGVYRVRITMSDPKTHRPSHHTVVQEVVIGSGTTNRVVELTPIDLNIAVLPANPVNPGGGGSSPPPGGSIDLTGTWQATLFGQDYIYHITQNGKSFTWSQPQLSEAATGTVVSGNKVSATLHGPHAPTPPVVEGTIKTDPSGVPVEIAWNNGVKFVRVGPGSGPSPPGGPIDLSGAWRANLFGQWVSYKITQNGNNFNWTASHFGETANGTISGTSVTATISNQFGKHPPVSGTVQVDSNGTPTAIIWSNGVTFVRGT